MRNLVFATLTALTLASAPAHADSITTNCFHSRHGGRCTTSFTGDPTPVELTDHDRQVMKERDDKWEAFCQPHEVTGADGLPRVTYAHKNCDIGVSQ